jgi:hypothetical protein
MKMETACIDTPETCFSITQHQNKKKKKKKKKENCIAA